MTATCEEVEVQKCISRLTDNIKKLPVEELDKLERWVASSGKKVFSIKEAADVLNMRPDTIRKAIRAKTLKAFQINQMEAWRIPKEEIERFMGTDGE